MRGTRDNKFTRAGRNPVPWLAGTKKALEDSKSVPIQESDKPAGRIKYHWGKSQEFTDMEKFIAA